MLCWTTVRLSTVLIAGGLLAPVASATITASMELWSTGTLTDGREYVAYHVFVDITGADDWLAASLDASISGATFHVHPLGTDPPNPALWVPFPDLEWDTYYTGPSPYDPSFWVHSNDTPTQLDTDWGDYVDTGDGGFMIAQITVLPGDSAWQAEGLLRVTSADSAGEWFEYPFELVGGDPDPPGDVDGDHDVDLADLAALLAAYDTCAGDPDYNPDADFDDSGCIDLSDLATLLANYGFGT